MGCEIESLLGILEKKIWSKIAACQSWINNLGNIFNTFCLR
jgi:hypothetical protein